MTAMIAVWNSALHQRSTFLKSITFVYKGIFDAQCDSTSEKAMHAEITKYIMHRMNCTFA